MFASHRQKLRSMLKLASISFLCLVTLGATGYMRQNSSKPIDSVDTCASMASKQVGTFLAYGDALISRNALAPRSRASGSNEGPRTSFSQRGMRNTARCQRSRQAKASAKPPDGRTQRHAGVR